MIDALLQKNWSDKIGISALAMLWVMVQAIVYLHFGIKFGVDSERYIQIANSIAQGNLPNGTDIFYTTYCLLIAGLQLLGLSAVWIVLFQVFLSGVALIGIYNIVRTVSNNRLTPWLACLLYILWFKFQQWNLIVYTDSLFTSAVILSVWILVVADNKLKYVTAFIIVTLTIFIRPAGIGLLFAISSYLFMDKLNFNRGKIYIRLTAAFLLLGFAMVTLNVFLKDFISSFLKSYANAEIIYPGISLGIQKPVNLIIPGDHHQPILQLINFAFYNPFYMIQISILKGILFLGHIKPYYSIFHNLVIGIYLYPIYAFALIGVKQIRQEKIFLFMMVFIGFNLLAVSLTSENWDGRFLLPILPWIFIMASFGITHFLQKKNETSIGSGILQT